MCTADCRLPVRAGRRRSNARRPRWLERLAAGLNPWRDSQPERGFTLIELANVIMIVSVLTLIGLPTISDGHKTVKRTSCAERQRKIFEGAILYAAENIVPNGDVNVTVLYPDYLNQQVGECPESVAQDWDDYTITFVGGAPVDVSCDIEGDEHPWEPH